MKAIYRFSVDYGRMGGLSGIFSANMSDIESLYGKVVYFGEVLGKHSDVSVEIDTECIDFITDDQQVVKMFDFYDMRTGINPLEYCDN